MILAYKAFYPGLKGQGSFQYEVGRTYTSHNDGIGRHGFHAALDPGFCLRFISPSQGGVYGEVEIDGAIDRGAVNLDDGAGQHTAVTGESIRVLRILPVEQMLLRAVNFRTLKAEEDGKVTRAADSRFGVAVGSGRFAVAIADVPGGYASVQGDWSCALATQDGCTVEASGPESIAAALRPGCWAGGDGYILLADWNNPSALAWLKGKKDRVYALVDGEIKNEMK